jgi:2-octaprenyl-6-methoxyphenol hydroxylase
LRADLRSLLGRIGQVAEIGPLHRLALHMQVRDSVRTHRIVAVGNAAQALHPVAGQGFNLGLRDCATLAACLATHQGGAPAALAQYQHRRSRDRSTIVAVTRWLPDVFASRLTPLALARSLGLTALDVLPPLRRELAQLLMFGVRT